MGGLEATFAAHVVVVTGAGGGIGRAVCVGFSTDGAVVVGIGRRPGALAETATLCPGPMTAVCADLSQPDEAMRAIEEAVAAHGRIDVLVNNAGTAATGAFVETPFDQWTEVVAVNLLGAAACSRAALPHMIRRDRGRIITLTSRLAGRAAPANSAYSASKAAVTALTGCLAAEITSSHPNILINDLIPGLTRTGMSAEGQDPEAVYPFVRALALLPSGGPSGQTFFRGETFDVFATRRE
jgi:meso-butanediol dehydrogenase/(S,S)-butanediol dehydrogenase/diacetyl reductase